MMYYIYTVHIPEIVDDVKVHRGLSLDLDDLPDGRLVDRLQDRRVDVREGRYRRLALHRLAVGVPDDDLQPRQWATIMLYSASSVQFRGKL